MLILKGMVVPEYLCQAVYAGGHTGGDVFQAVGSSPEQRWV